MEACGQDSWVFPHGALEEHAQALVALEGDEPVGFLVFVVQEIRPPDSCPPLVGPSGEVLTEAKVSAFAVRDDRRRRGIGEALQQQAVELARRLGCYQVRSASDYRHEENHRLKLRLGFGAHPGIREVAGERRPTIFYVKTVA